MAASLIVVFPGPPEQRIPLKFSPMTTLQAVLQEACAKSRPAQDHALWQLVVHGQKKPVDLTLSFRLANIPAGSRLDMVQVAPASTPASGPTSQQNMAQAQPQNLANIPQQAQAASTANDGTATAPPASSLAPTSLLPGLDRPAMVFTQAALEATLATHASPEAAEEPPEEFYEMTPEDFAAISRAQEARKKGEMTFRTRAHREAEKRAAAESYGPIPVRFHLPDATIVQASFSALDEVAQLQAFVSACLAEGLAGRCYLYTTPPRQVLKNLEATLHEAGLCPAANVHVGFKEVQGQEHPAGPFLRPQLHSHVSQSAPEDALAVPHRQGEEPAAGKLPSSNSGAVPANQPDEAGPSGGGPSRYITPGPKPKWLKLGAGK